MNSAAIKSLAICVFGVAALAGCASQPSTPAVASAQGAAQSATVTAVEATAVVDQTAVQSSSGSGGAVVTTASGGPSLITVKFNDGKEGRYVIEHPSTGYTVGEPVYVITDGERITIVPQK
ncbi:MAG TPA: hypothetical protein VF450_06440 [Noviherbaspirillum sp.]